MSESGQVALWYRRYGHIGCELYSSEDDAASVAVAMVEANSSAPVGVQFPDGRQIDVDDWPAYAEAERRLSQVRSEWASKPPPPKPPQRKIKDPFGGETIEVDADEPQWLGERLAP